MKKIILALAIISTILSSCTTQKAVTYKGTHIHSGAYDVYPQWKREKSTFTKIAPYTIGVSAALYGYYGRDPIVYEGNEYSQGATSAIYGLAGLIFSATLSSQLGIGERKSDKYHASHGQKWVSEFNKRHNASYTIVGNESSYPLRIVPFDRLEQYKFKEEIIDKTLLSQKYQKTDAERVLQAAAIAAAIWAGGVLLSELFNSGSSVQSSETAEENERNRRIEQWILEDAAEKKKN